MVDTKLAAKIGAAVVASALLNGCAEKLTEANFSSSGTSELSRDLLTPRERVEAFKLLLRGAARQEYPAPMGGLGGDGILTVLGPRHDRVGSNYELLISKPGSPQEIIRSYTFSERGHLVDQHNVSGRLVNNDPKDDYHYGDLTLKDTRDLVKQGLKPLAR